MRVLICALFLCFNVVFCQFGFQNQPERGYRRYDNTDQVFNYVPNVQRLTGVITFNPETSRRNENNYPFNTNQQYYQYDRYGRPIYNNYPQPNVNYPRENQRPFIFSGNQNENVNYDGFFIPNNNYEIVKVDLHSLTENYEKTTVKLEPLQPVKGDDSPVFGDNSNSNPVLSNEDAKPEDKPELIDKRGETTELPALTPVPKNQEVEFAVFQETCTTVDGDVGSCLSYKQCPQYLALAKAFADNPNANANAVQLLRKAHCGFQGKDAKVCCPLPGIPSSPPELTTTTTTPAPPLDNGEVLLSPPHCGFSNASLGRVVGGVPAKLGDFPWVVLLGYKPRRGQEANWKCGGSLIGSRLVLTAAHCIHNHEQDLYKVRIGELDIARDDDGASPIDIPIKTKVKHEDYSPTSFTNDIGILHLEFAVQFTAIIQPICVPKQPELRARSFERYTPIIAGWGATSFRGESASHLQALQLPVVTNDFCKQAYAPYKAQTIDDRVLCAGYKKGGRDACQGDSGGPLMQPIPTDAKTFFYQIGVVSYGKKCAEAGFPGVYTRVTHFVPWIEKTVKSLV